MLQVFGFTLPTTPYKVDSLYFQPFYGDLLNASNVEDFLQQCAYVKSDLVLADGALNCIHEENTQEDKNFVLIYNELMLTLRILKTGGTCVLKILDAYTEETFNCINLMYNSFATCYIIKPKLSRPANSEKYIIGINLKPKEKIINNDYTLEIFHQIYKLNEQQIKFISSVINRTITMYTTNQSRRIQLSESINIQIPQNIVNYFNNISIPQNISSKRLLYEQNYTFHKSKGMDCLFKTDRVCYVLHKTKTWLHLPVQLPFPDKSLIYGEMINNNLYIIDILILNNHSLQTTDFYEREQLIRTLCSCSSLLQYEPSQNYLYDCEQQICYPKTVIGYYILENGLYYDYKTKSISTNIIKSTPEYCLKNLRYIQTI